MKPLLEGVRILDLSRMLSGPYGSMIMADMGAEVIKIEDPRGGDGTRALGQYCIEGETAYFVSINRNKKSITISRELHETIADTCTPLDEDASTVVGVRVRARRTAGDPDPLDYRIVLRLASGKESDSVRLAAG